MKNATNYRSFLMNEKEHLVNKPIASLTLGVWCFNEKTVPENRAVIKALQLVFDAYEAIHKADKISNSNLC